MAGRGETGRRNRSGAIRALVVAVIVGGLAIVSNMSQPASATLTGSPFDGSDGSPTTDLAAGVIKLTDPVGNADTTNYTSGAKDDTICPAVGTGTAQSQGDLDAFYFGSKANASGVFLYVGWGRPDLTGTTTIAFELNHSSGPKPNCNGFNPARTAGDLLLTYDFQGTGPFTLDISKQLWVGDSNAGAWGPKTALPAGSFEAQIDKVGSFGELVVNLTAANLLSTNGCESFASVFPRTKASTSTNPAIKDFVAPKKAVVSNCGSITIHKQDDAGAALANVTFDLYTDVNGAMGVPVVPAQSCTTDATGDCTILNVFPGAYWMKEKATPTGYTGAAPRRVVVALAGNTDPDPQVFVNTRKPATVKIIKKDDAGALLDGAGFTLYTDVNNAPGSPVSNKTCTTGTTGTGTCTISNVPAPGTYWIVETTTPLGHDTAAPVKVTVGLNETVTRTFFDDRQPATVNILKKDKDTGGVLADATFGLYTNGNNAPGTAVSGKTCTTTSPTGTCSITDILPPGTYWVVETGTPAGYDTAAAQKVTLDLNTTVDLTFEDARKPVSIALVKTVDGAAHPSGSPLVTESGQQVTYSITVTNTGQNALTIDSLTDTLKTGVASTCTQGVGSSLAAGASFTCTYTSSPTDDAENKATVTAHDVLNRTVEAFDSAFVTPLHPSISVDKSGPDGAHVGDVVTYTFKVENTGDTPLTSVAVTDARCSSAPKTSDDDGSLDVGETWTYTCPYTVAAADGDQVANTVEVSGTDPLGTVVKAGDDHVFPVLHPAITLDKSADPTSVHDGETVTYSYLATNTGDTPLSDVVVKDDILGTIGTIATLNPGQSVTLTRSVVVGAGSAPINVGTASGTDRLGRTVQASDTQSITVVLAEVIERVPELPRTGAPVQRELRLALWLTGAGLFLVWAARRRKAIGDR